MTHLNHAQTAATRTAASLPQRLHRLLVVVVSAWFGMTLTSVSLAASSPSPNGQSTTKPHATAAHRPSTPSTATTPKSQSKAKSTSKSKTAVAQHPTQARKTPTKARVAAKSKPATRAHQPASKPAKKLATKQNKHTA